MIRGIAFDLFDTLVDQNHDRLPSVDVGGRLVSATTPDLHRRLIADTGSTLSIDEFADLQEETDRGLFRETLKKGVELPTVRRFQVLAERLGRTGDDALAAAWTDVHMSVLREAVSVPSHHESVLATLAVDHRLALCSNFSHSETAREILDEARFTPHLSSIVISEDLGIRKPRPEIFAEVARQLDLPPDEILHVGDSLRADVAGAAEVGMPCVWLTRQIADPDAELDRFDGPRPEFSLEDLLDLPVLIARLSV